MSLKIFNSGWRIAWFLTAATLAVAELTPFHSEGVSTLAFYAWKLFKCLCFLLIGFETPLAIWRFDRLTNGFLLAIASAALIESIQNFVVGHHFSVLELAGKAILISAGFALGLIARHDQVISLGPFNIRLISQQKVIH